MVCRGGLHLQGHGLSVLMTLPREKKPMKSLPVLDSVLDDFTRKLKQAPVLSFRAKMQKMLGIYEYPVLYRIYSLLRKLNLI